MHIGQMIEVTKARPKDNETYSNGDCMVIFDVWANGGGVCALDEEGNRVELYTSEFKVVPSGAATASDAVNNPNHYNTGKFETIELIEAVTSGYTDGYQAYCIGNAMKYISRAPFKHGSPVEDLQKAAKYLEFAIKALQQPKGEEAA